MKETETMKLLIKNRVDKIFKLKASKSKSRVTLSLSINTTKVVGLLQYDCKHNDVIRRFKENDFITKIIDNEDYSDVSNDEDSDKLNDLKGLLKHPEIFSASETKIVVLSLQNIGKESPSTILDGRL